MLGTVSMNLEALLVDRLAAWARDVREGLRPRTLRGYLYLLALLPGSGIHQLKDLTRENLLRHIRERREKDGICSATAKKIHVATLSFASWLEQNEEIPLTQLHSLREIRIKQPPAPPPRFLTREEYVRLVVAARSHRRMLGLAVAIAVHTGLRMNELRCLHHEEIVLDTPEPFVRVTRDDGRELKTATPRTPPFFSGFAASLRDLGVGWPRRGPVFPAQNLHQSRSAYLGHKALERWMAHARAAAGLQDEVNFVTLRHTYASWCIQSGISIAKVARWMGHSVAICWKHYAGLMPGGDREVDRAFLVPKTPPRPTPFSEIPTPPLGYSSTS